MEWIKPKQRLLKTVHYLGSISDNIFDHNDFQKTTFDKCCGVVLISFYETPLLIICYGDSTGISVRKLKNIVLPSSSDCISELIKENNFIIIADVSNNINIKNNIVIIGKDHNFWKKAIPYFD